MEWYNFKRITTQPTQLEQVFQIHIEKSFFLMN